jgi:hypothetical protein
VEACRVRQTRGEHSRDHEVRRGVGHAAAAARWAEAATLARECHQFLARAGIAANADEAVREDPAREKGAKLALHEPRYRAFASLRFGEKALSSACTTP